MKITSEAHMHMLMDGLNYKEAVALHKTEPQTDIIRQRLQQYQDAGITYLRDGGDALKVSSTAKQLAEEYGLHYSTPTFAIHKCGHYGSIVGHGFHDLKEYYTLVQQAASEGADFIKIMTTGLLDFANGGQVTGEDLSYDEVKEMIHIAHEEGFSVMSHTNGDAAARILIECGADSLEHGNYMSKETIDLLAESHTIWVPTLAAVEAMKYSGRYPVSLVDEICKKAASNIQYAFQKGVKCALGSDGGAYLVPHCKGVQKEYQLFQSILGDSSEVDEWLSHGNQMIQEFFQRK